MILFAPERLRCCQNVQVPVVIRKVDVVLVQWRPFMGEMTRVASLKFQGELLEILYNVMQRPVGHDQRAYSASML